MIPTMRRVQKVYLESAAIERLKCGKPGQGTVDNTRAGVRKFLQFIETRDLLGDKLKEFDTVWDIPITIITPRLIRKYLSLLLKEDFKPISAMSYVLQLRQLFARWVHPYYEDHGWKIPQFPPLACHAKPPRYVRPSKEQIKTLKDWYEGLSATLFPIPDDPCPTTLYHLWYAATMMLEFGMRNGDILRLKRANFTECGGRIHLAYTPHKTAHSSGRIVRWPIHPDIWRRLDALFSANGNDTPVFDAEETFAALNRKMRGFGFTGTKGAYELRKICIDHVYQRFGAEIAVSISGDDIRTIMRYYADPSQPNVGDLKITDLL